MAVPWLQQRASNTIPAGDEADSHDDFKPVQKQGSSELSAHEAIEKVIHAIHLLAFVLGGEFCYF